MSDKLTPERIAEIRERLEAAQGAVDAGAGALCELKWDRVRRYAPSDIAALLSHVAALDAELAAARAENARLRKVAKAAVEMDYWIDDLTGAKETVDAFKAAIAAYAQEAE